MSLTQTEEGQFWIIYIKNKATKSRVGPGFELCKQIKKKSIPTVLGKEEREQNKINTDDDDD